MNFKVHTPVRGPAAGRVQDGRPASGGGRQRSGGGSGWQQGGGGCAEQPQQRAHGSLHAVHATPRPLLTSSWPMAVQVIPVNNTTTP